ncbi:MAG: glycoside hydrolase family 16 protein [Alphaproteobacteria bacterium]
MTISSGEGFSALVRRTRGLVLLAVTVLACLVFGRALLANTMPENSSSAPTLVSQIDHHRLRLTFNDDFSTLNLRHGDQGIWSTSYGYGGVDNFTLTNNHELQLYVDPQFKGSGDRPLGVNPFSIDEGVLDITASRATPEIHPYLWGYDYLSGLLTTRRSFGQRYGYFEIRARLPTTQGTWPAFWLLPTDSSWPPEIDVVEYLGREPNVFYASTHAKPDGRRQDQTGRIEIPGEPGQFHRYGVLWDENEVVWYLDGVEVQRAATPADMHKPMYMLVNLAIGGWGGVPDPSTPFPTHMSVDYVRAYALDPN